MPGKKPEINGIDSLPGKKPGLRTVGRDFLPTPGSEMPFVSVIIPVHNDADGIRQTLRSLFAQTYPKTRYEIIVVDNRSEDDTFLTIQKMVSEFDGNIVVETEAVKGSYAARNRGIDISRGEILAFIDSDMTVGPDWLYNGVSCFFYKKADYIGCRIDIVSSRNRLSLWEKYDMALGFPVKVYMEIDGYAPTACLFATRKVIDAVGNFNHTLLSGGDREFGTRVRDHGFTMVYDPENVMYHPARHSFLSLIQKQKRVTLGQIRLCRLFPGRFAHNRLKDVAICCLQILPVASPEVIRQLSRSGADFFPLFGGFYIFRLYTCWLKFTNKCLFF